MVRAALAVAAAYVVGSLPTAFLLVRWLRGTDIRGTESGSVGALNAFRATGAGWVGWTVLVVDVLKGVVAVALAGPGASTGVQALVAAAVVAGHNWPVWLRGKGGKGLATAAGACTIVTPVAVPLWGVLWGIGYVASGYIVAGTLLATLLLPVAVGVVAGWGFGLALVPVCVLILARHRAKVRALLLGSEPRHYWRAKS
jgi:acyl phosphate:glycerol-3-phosphate acyltransferase